MRALGWVAGRTVGSVRHMADRVLRTIIDGLAFGEGPRWHDGRLFVSDMHGAQVLAIDDAGASAVVARVANQPSGLGWLPDGRMLVVSMTDRRVLRMEADGSLVEHADLSGLAPWHCNDMTVDGRGNAYVGNFGWDLIDRTTPHRRTNVILVRADGSFSEVAGDLNFPNGMVVTPDGDTLVVGESGAGCLTSFRIAADGSLHDRRLWATLPQGSAPDGICLDAAGAIWSACPMTGTVWRIADGGEILDQVHLPEGEKAYACTLGGAERRTLFICASSSHMPDECRARRDARVVAVEVEVAGAGWP